MKRWIAHVLIGALLAWTVMPPAVADAQITANVVTSCGTPNATYPATSTRAVTQDTTGTLCTTSSGGGGGGGTPATATSLCNNAVAAGTGKPLNIDLFSALCAIIVDPTTHQPAALNPALPAGSNLIGHTDGAGANNASPVGNPNLMAGVAQTAEPPLATNGYAAQLATDLAHKLIIAPYANPENLVSGLTIAMTGTTSTAFTGMGAPGSGLHNYITTLVCGNSHASVGTFVTLQDGSGGTGFFTVPAGAVYNGSVLTFPAPLRQPTANTGLYAVDVTTGANVICSAAGYKGQ